ncbi:MAG TPA: 1-deoxy-D-xylulose-5-phosphate synthase N-terminal domain-containing protein, partial [Bdellovibrionota bacterium]|nr:1-deoxy-D-xylulose-5-phosphate synthase N-terminal domain-containing protein [Bdellovibrionota bacterium]
MGAGASGVAPDLGSLRLLAEDVRQRIVSVSLKNGGHLGASLGAVELAIALHAVFRSPDEPIVWDVGHQAYAHKLLTGRWESFDTLRQDGGISGFLSRDESPHDVFGAGHSSTALSAALAMAWARGTHPDDRRFTVAVVGDGGLTAGLALEALNNVSATGPLGPLL